MSMEIEDLAPTIEQGKRKSWHQLVNFINSKYNTTFSTKQLEKHFSERTKGKTNSLTRHRKLYVICMKILNPQVQLLDLALQIDRFKSVIRDEFNTTLLFSEEFQILHEQVKSLTQIVQSKTISDSSFLNFTNFKKVQKKIENLIKNRRVIDVDLSAINALDPILLEKYRFD